MTPHRVAALALAAVIALTAGVGAAGGAAPEDAATRARATEVLRHALASTGGFVRIHAAETLIEHGHPEGVAALYTPERDNAAPPYRIGVWRVLARVAADPAERRDAVARIRAALADPAGGDRVHAAESLAKLGAAQAADLAVIDAWLPQADAPTAAFLRWLRVQLAPPAERAAEELALARLLESDLPAARRRAAYALARLPGLAPETVRRLHRAADAESPDSPARTLLLCAAIVHPAGAPGRVADLRRRLRERLADGSAAEQFEAAPVLGRGGERADAALLVRLLEHPEPDARIGAAGGLLHLLREP